MVFPKVGNIATTSVVTIDINSLISDAIKKMFSNEHRNIVVTEGNIFRIMRVADILNMKARGVELESSLKNRDLPIIPVVNKEKTILYTLEYLNSETEYVCAVNDDGSLYGLISHTDIISSIDPDTLMDNFCLVDFLKLGKRSKWVNKDLKTSELLCEMAKNSFESVIIVEDLKPIGIFTTKDVIGVIEKNKDLNVPISKYMSSPVETIAKNSSVKEAIEFLKKKHYKRVIVVDDDGKMSGVVSQKELIATTYSRWAALTKEYQKELDDINSALVSKNIKYEEMASRDSLTNLYNRYKFLKLYESSHKTMLERENEMSLIMVDIDYFKKINDTYGHNVGDSVIVEVSKALLKGLRNIDMVCRWGGEEFVILLPAVNIENTLLIAEKLRCSIEELRVEGASKVTASFGVSRVKRDDDISSVVNRADMALYLAKSSGRNCVKKAD
ncbi:diguanylate cyclase [Sulfurimonas sp.]|jgi:diguanylate cyclase (GGDEF)-like protein|uniref:diguanylate cyclase n=1 Tax=Sulfurimonas sp. TaxID=2022749 RepID=UPI0025E1520C|nr:diguanylate cyclase [Sulfurimonas sp.]MCK9472412.1 diguanylate cyclase [Sulfurimonas sp.]MDD3506347.1 diguanylate cyclase [Sulfurimonas sp.]